MNNYQEFVDVDSWKSMIDKEKNHFENLKPSKPINKKLEYPLITLANCFFLNVIVR